MVDPSDYSDSVQDCLEVRVDVVRTSLRQLQEKLSQVRLDESFGISFNFKNLLMNQTSDQNLGLH